MHVTMFIACLIWLCFLINAVCDPDMEIDHTAAVFGLFTVLVIGFIIGSIVDWSITIFWS